MIKGSRTGLEVSLIDKTSKETEATTRRPIHSELNQIDETKGSSNMKNQTKSVDVESSRHIKQEQTRSSEVQEHAQPAQPSAAATYGLRKSYEELRTEVAHLRLQATLTKANTAKLERQGGLLRAINQRKKQWLADCDADLARQSVIINMAVNFPAADQFGHQWQRRNISHNSILMNFKKDLRAQIDELTTKTLQRTVEVPPARFTSDVPSVECLNALEKGKDNIVKATEARERVKKKEFEEEMQLMLFKRPMVPATTLTTTTGFNNTFAQQD